MKKIVLKTIMILLIVVLLNISKCYAAGASLSLNNNDVTPGSTVELYVALTTESQAFEINVKPTTNSNLIETSELTSKIGEGNTSKIYLVQVAPESERKTYTSGTRIATIKYKISNSAKAGDKITINVSGDVGGKTSEEKNTMNENITINVVAATPSTPDKTPTGDKQEQPAQQPNQQQPAKNDTSSNKATGKIPKAGIIEEKYIIPAITIIIILQVVLVIRYVKLNK